VQATIILHPESGISYLASSTPFEYEDDDEYEDELSVPNHSNRITHPIPNTAISTIA